MNYSNNAYSVLESGITGLSTTIILAAGTGSRFPSSNFPATLIGYDVEGNETSWEIVLCSSRTIDTLTVTRGQEGTSAVAWAGGSRIENRLTAAGLSASTATNIHAATAKATPVDADELGLSDSAATWGLKKLTFADLKAWIGSFFVSKSGDTITGNLNFGGVGRRITGDFSDVTVANRVTFQTSTANGNTNVGVLPNGTAVVAAVRAYGASDPTNASVLDMAVVGGSDARITSAGLGTGTSLPMTFYIGNAERLRIDTSGNVGVAKTPTTRLDVDGVTRSTGFSLSGGGVTGGTSPFSQGTISTDVNWGMYFRVTSGSASIAHYSFRSAGDAEYLRIDTSGNVLATGGALGYGVGSGGTVTQATSKSTAVTLNKPSGIITLNSAELAAGASINFGLLNSYLNMTDGLIVHANGFFGYSIELSYFNSDGNAVLRLTNNGATRSDAVLITFRVIKGASS